MPPLQKAMHCSPKNCPSSHRQHSIVPLDTTFSPTGRKTFNKYLNPSLHVNTKYFYGVLTYTEFSRNTTTMYSFITTIPRVTHHSGKLCHWPWHSWWVWSLPHNTFNSPHAQPSPWDDRSLIVRVFLLYECFPQENVAWILGTLESNVLGRLWGWIGKSFVPNLALSQLKWKYLILKDFIFGSEVGATHYKVVLCNIAQRSKER